ncbi:MAG TPA: zinc-dependent metalloprotease, partial [Balneola sp.]|nr:zinc-dependent metalloprotease [Balneola sp.]
MNYGIKLMGRFFALSLCFVLVVSGCKSSGAATKSGKSSASTQRPPAKKGDLKKFSEVITKDAKTDEGLFNVHKVDDKYYFEIPNEMLEREMLLVSRVAGSVQNLSFGGAGQKARGQQVVRWQRKENNILLRHVSYSSVANEDDPIYKSVQNNNFEPVVYSFKIEANNEDTTGVVVDVTSLYTSDVALISGLSDFQRRNFQVRRLDGSRSFVEKMSSYPENIEVRHVLTYDAGNPPDNGSTNTISLEMNQSMILLPAEPAQPRNWDQRVGYFSIGQYDYSSEEHKAATNRFITRYKLVPKDKEAYLRG